jgi:hypothetical protein
MNPPTFNLDRILARARRQAALPTLDTRYPLVRLMTARISAYQNNRDRRSPHLEQPDATPAPGAPPSDGGTGEHRHLASPFCNGLPAGRPRGASGEAQGVHPEFIEGPDFMLAQNDDFAPVS